MIPALLLLLATVGAPTAPGDQLYELGLYEAAVTEYLRELHDGIPDSDPVRLKLALSRAAAGELEPAAAELRALAREESPTASAGALALAGIFATRGRYERARFELNSTARHIPDSDRVRLGLALAWLDLNCAEFGAARARYADLGRPELVAQLSRNPARRNPELAVALSALVPGAGESYAGRPGPGLLNLLVTGTAAAGTWYAAKSGDWVSAGVVFTLLFLRFYQGSRANAADMAEEFNRVALRDHIARLDAEAALEPDWFGPAEQITGLRRPVPQKAPGR